MEHALVKVPPAITGVHGVVLDTMVLIYLLEDHSVYADRCEHLLQWASEGAFLGIISPITVAELLVKPLEAGRNDLADQYKNALRNLPNIDLCKCSWETGVMAGALKAKYKMPLPDMFQVALAMEHGGVLITNDKALKKIAEVTIVLLSEIN